MKPTGVNPNWPLFTSHCLVGLRELAICNVPSDSTPNGSTIKRATQIPLHLSDGDHAPSDLSLPALPTRGSTTSIRPIGPPNLHHAPPRNQTIWEVPSPGQGVHPGGTTNGFGLVGKSRVRCDRWVILLVYKPNQSWTLNLETIRDRRCGGWKLGGLTTILV